MKSNPTCKARVCLLRRSAALCALLLASEQPALGQGGDIERVTTGTLTCTTEAARSVTAPVTRGVSCTFDRTGNAPGGSYLGDIIHRGPSGPDIELGSREVLAWNVWAPKTVTTGLSLLGKYFGVRKDDPGAAGLGANTLVGAQEPGILLEPVVNPETLSGPATIRTVIELELKPAKT
jgi:hypothetical protein